MLHYLFVTSLLCSRLQQLCPLLFVASLYTFKFPLFNYPFIASLLCSRLRLYHLLFLISLYYFLKISIVSLSLSVCCVTALFRLRLFHLLFVTQSRSQKRSAPPGGASNHYCVHHVCHPGVVGFCGRGGPPALGTAGG